MSLLLLAPAFAATMSFDVDGVLVKGDTLRIAPYGGTPVTEIESVGHALDGILTVLILDDGVRTSDGRNVGSVTLIPAAGMKIAATDAGAEAAGDPVAFYALLGRGTVEAGLDLGRVCGQGDACDGDDDGSGRLDGSFVFGTTSYLETRQGQFVFGTTSYFKEKPKTKPKPKTTFLDGQTVYFRTARGEIVQVVGDVGGDGGDRHVAAAFGTELCSAAVWDGDGLVYAAVVPCDSSIGYASSTGDEETEVPYVATAELVWSDTARGFVPSFVWSWTFADTPSADRWVK